MKIEVNYFGMISEAVDKEKEVVEVQEGLMVSGLLQALWEKYPIRTLPQKVSVNQSIELDDIQLKEGDEIALLPPFAGG